MKPLDWSWRAKWNIGTGSVDVGKTLIEIKSREKDGGLYMERKYIRSCISLGVSLQNIYIANLKCINWKWKNELKCVKMDISEGSNNVQLMTHEEGCILCMCSEEMFSSILTVFHLLYWSGSKWINGNIFWKYLIEFRIFVRFALSAYNFYNMTLARSYSYMICWAIIMNKEFLMNF